jgi:ssDNA-binding Zn-finger/Zn-ribbon topoisomerase 1
LNILDGDSRRKHIADIRAFPAAEDVCPRCGKPLVTRRGKYGEFIGCSGYPSCRFTTQVKK